MPFCGSESDAVAAELVAAVLVAAVLVAAVLVTVIRPAAGAGVRRAFALRARERECVDLEAAAAASFMV
jgi:hypothetical protein